MQSFSNIFTYWEGKRRSRTETKTWSFLSSAELHQVTSSTVPPMAQGPNFNIYYNNNSFHIYYIILI